MKELLEILARNLVEKPESVSVTQVTGEDTITLELRVAQEDMGKVIGKSGKIAKAIRSVVKAASVNESKRVLVEII